MRQLLLLVFSVFLIAACNSEKGKKKSGAAGFPPAAGAEATVDDNKSKSDDESGGSSRSNDDDGAWAGRFNIEAPEGWTKADTLLMGNTFTFLRSPEEENDDFLENVNVIKEKVGNASLEEYYEKSLSMMKQRLPGFHEIESTNKDINGIEFKNVKYTHIYNGMTVAVDLYLAVRKKTGFVITCSAKEGKLSQYQPAFDQIIRSFSFE